MVVKEIAFTVYPARDVAASRAWYETHLGLRFAGPYLEDGVEKYNEAHLTGGVFALMWAEWTQRPAGSAGSIAFEVDDLEKALAELEADGIPIGDRSAGPVCKQASIADPDGNRVTLHQRL